MARLEPQIMRPYGSHGARLFHTQRLRKSRNAMPAPDKCLRNFRNDVIALVMGGGNYFLYWDWGQYTSVISLSAAADTLAMIPVLC